jgi:hypothetical protein
LVDSERLRATAALGVLDVTESGTIRVSPDKRLLRCLRGMSTRANCPKTREGPSETDMLKLISRRGALAGIAAAALASSALAHHGWSWTADEQSELTGTIREIFIGNPHAVLQVEASDGLWTVELAPPGRTRAAGFDENAAKVGDSATLVGNRSKDPDEKRMKAVRVIVNGKTYDVYPDRVGS